MTAEQKIAKAGDLLRSTLKDLNLVASDSDLITFLKDAEQATDYAYEQLTQEELH